ncbi:hypothetical protein BDP27DRAFT_1361231 [Rhodocollybia butyracea]|uniref:Uncharacterized protein n=1 Tax=Rhodocollybia butyracea TaxID=206335 RepID=A0A9P5UAM0_9AGAR|nr:hypothetical protein BDP27DRAFT_1361231 [Rhodocollybia butyracea]
MEMKYNSTLPLTNPKFSADQTLKQEVIGSTWAYWRCKHTAADLLKNLKALQKEQNPQLETQDPKTDKLTEIIRETDKFEPDLQAQEIAQETEVWQEHGGVESQVLPFNPGMDRDGCTDIDMVGPEGETSIPQDNAVQVCVEDGKRKQITMEELVKFGQNNQPPTHKRKRTMPQILPTPYLWIEGMGRHVLSDFQNYAQDISNEAVWLVKFVDREQAVKFRQTHNRTNIDSDTFHLYRATLAEYMWLKSHPKYVIDSWISGEVLSSMTQPPQLMR